VFEWTYVTTDLQMQKIITWQMKTSFRPDGPVDFYIDKARSGGEWEEIAGPITDDCLHIDPVRWNWNKDMNTFYRIRYDSGTEEWVYSVPVRAIGGWDRRDFALMKAIVRKELLTYNKLGLTGVLLKRRDWGQLCATCAEFDTGEAVDGQCPECFGTGISGGYYAPIPKTVLPLDKNQQRQTTKMALNDDTQRSVRCVAYPTLIKDNDLWLDDSNGTRWTVRGVKTVAELKGVPLVYQLVLKRIPMTDIIYREPEGTDKATEIPAEQTTGTEHTWYAGICEEQY
jgi:hypothetical protein